MRSKLWKWILPLCLTSAAAAQSSSITVLDMLTSNTTGIVNGTCTPPPLVTSFSNMSQQVWLYFDVNGASAGDTVQVNFIRPDGALYAAFNGSVSSVNPAGYQCFSYYIAINGYPAASFPGTWTIQTFWNQSSAPLFTLNFALSGPAGVSATFNNQRVSTQAPPSSGCVVPTAASSFLTSDSTVYLYFESTVTTNDNLAADWLAPDGAVLNISGWNAVSGTFCFTGASLAINDLPPSRLGPWQARVFDNGTLLFTVPFTVNPAAPQNIQITGLSSTRATALTPIYISTSGLIPNSPVLVHFADNSGYSATEKAIRVASDGTVVAGVPLYVNPSSGATGSAAVTVIVYQNGSSSPPQTLAIQDLPSVSSYGVNPGDLSRAFTNYSAMVTARRINEFQAVQAWPGNTVDTSAAQSTLQQLLLAQIASRSDVDRVAADPTLRISGGTTPNGAAVQFDRNSLDMMDRIYGLYLSESGSSFTAPSTPALSGGSARVLRPFRRANPALSPFPSRFGLLSTRVRGDSTQPLASGPIQNVLTIIGSAANLTTGLQSRADYTAKDATTLDKTLAVSNGIGAVLGQASTVFPTSTLLGRINAAVGAFNATAGLLVNFGNEIGAAAYLMVNCNGAGANDEVCNDAANDIETNRKQAIVNTLAAEENLIGLAVPASILEAYNGAGNVALQSATLATNIAGCVEDPNCANYVANATAKVTNELSAGFNSAAQFGVAAGSAILTTSLGLASPLPGLEFFSGDSFNTLADPNGQYDMLLPLHDPYFNYSNATVEILDPESNFLAGSMTVDLSSLTTAGTVQIPTIQGTCSDDDAGNPDSDDPDCDGN
ncbi:MAG TPA: hypothetical protein VEV17_20615 [Bryobacteraceae bacterium]|nr:hypothetical protein [Bryobacteraceae bacterium]